MIESLNGAQIIDMCGTPELYDLKLKLDEFNTKIGRIFITPVFTYFFKEWGLDTKTYPLDIDSAYTKMLFSSTKFNIHIGIFEAGE